MNVFEFVLGIIIVATIASLYKLHLRRGRTAPVADREAGRLREEVEMLRDRIAVLERITIERENSLEREIEKLRER